MPHGGVAVHPTAPLPAEDVPPLEDVAPKCRTFGGASEDWEVAGRRGLALRGGG